MSPNLAEFVRLFASLVVEKLILETVNSDLPFSDHRDKKADRSAVQENNHDITKNCSNAP